MEQMKEQTMDGRTDGDQQNLTTETNCEFRSNSYRWSG